MWYRLSAYQGHVDGQVNIGVMYVRGWGVPKNYVRGHMWWSIAALSGDTGILKKIRVIERQMSPAQIAESKKKQKIELQRIKKPCKGIFTRFLSKVLENCR